MTLLKNQALLPGFFYCAGQIFASAAIPSMHLPLTPAQKFKSILRLITLTSVLGLSGCASVLVPPSEYEVFKVDKTQSGKERQITWMIRDDVAVYCAGLVGLRETIYMKPLACAKWSEFEKKCTIVTSSETTHTILGHELRHCFQGHFH